MDNARRVQQPGPTVALLGIEPAVTGTNAAAFTSEADTSATTTLAAAGNAIRPLVGNPNWLCCPPREAGFAAFTRRVAS